MAAVLPDEFGIRYVGGSSPLQKALEQRQPGGSRLAAVLLLSLGILLAGIAGSVVLMARSGEVRAGLLAACFSLLAVRQAIAAFYNWGKPIAFDADGAAETALLAASATGVFVLVALWRSLLERDRAETQHWESMEAVRALSELAVRWDLGLDRKFDELLGVGCSRFGLEIGVVSRVQLQRYEVLAIRAPDDHPVAKSDLFTLADTWCEQALRATRPLGLERTGDANAPPHAARAPFGFNAYLGAAVRVYGEVVGTVAFGSRLPHEERFTATDKDFVHLIAQWVGTELERHLATDERGTHSAPPPTRPKTKVSRRGTSIVRGVDVNQAIRRSEKNLRSLIGERARIDFQLTDDPRTVVNLRIALGTIIESLVHAVVDEAPPGGRISIATSNLDTEQPETDGRPNRARERHVTIEITATAPGIAADAFSRVFEAGAKEVPRQERDASIPRISASQVRHLLRRHGGDLSLQVEPGVCATLTLYLRCIDEVRPVPRAESPTLMRT